MPVMSFAHLKPMKGEKQQVIPSVPIQDQSSHSTPVRNQPAKPPGVLSFAHLRPGVKTKPAPPHPARSTIPQSASGQPDPLMPSEQAKPPVLPQPTPSRIWYRIPSVLLTARLAAVNYCRGCGRFMPADEWEKWVGNPYGRCRRDDVVIDGETWEFWKIIPASATVARCWFWMREVDQEIKLYGGNNDGI